MRKFFILISLMTAAVVAGCAGDHGDDIVVRLTDKAADIPPREVTVEYVNDRMRSVPEDVLPETGGEEGKREFLENIIHKELLVIEGMRQGLHEHERLPAYLETIRDNWTKRELLVQEVESKVEVTQEMIDEYISKLNWLYDLLQITTASKEDMEVALARVRGGEDFSQVAREMSVAKTAEDGGQLPQTGWRLLHPAVREAIDTLDVGDISEVVELPPFYLVFKIMNKKEGSGSNLSIQEKIGKEQEAKAYYTRKRESEFYREVLMEADPHIYDDAIALIGERTEQARMEKEAMPDTLDTEGMTPEEVKLAAVFIPEFSEQELEMPLATFGDRNWTIADYLEKLIEMGRDTGGFNTPRTGERRVIHGTVMSWIQEQLIQDEIEKRGLYEHPRLKDRVKHRMEEAIVNIIYNEKMLQTDPVIPGDEVRAQYRDNKEQYKSPLEGEVSQIIVDTEAKANELKQMLEEGGADFGELALKYSTDDYSKEKEGFIGKMVEGSGRTFSYLRPHVFEAEIGKIGGPVPGPVGSSVLFRVESRVEPRQLSFDEAEEMVRSDLTEVKQEERLQEWLEELKEKTEIEIFEDKIQYLDDPTTVEQVEPEI
jgi:parvulin-like peptidyl-prolyl isomerase